MFYEQGRPLWGEGAFWVLLTSVTIGSVCDILFSGQPFLLVVDRGDTHVLDIPGRMENEQYAAWLVAVSRKH
ncbi:hypothetical protein BDV19DRAFT_360745, partial [Aspergillus venezuelensis]